MLFFRIKNRIAKSTKKSKRLKEYLWKKNMDQLGYIITETPQNRGTYKMEKDFQTISYDMMTNQFDRPIEWNQSPFNLC